MGLHLFGKKKTNPETGEQTRSGLRGTVHKLGLNKLEKGMRPITKTLLPVVGSLTGSLFGGPMGALFGGGLGGALSSKKHPLDHALGGVAVGLGNAFLGPKIGQMLGISQEGMMGKALNMGGPGLFDQVKNMLGPVASFMSPGGGGATEGATQAAEGASGSGGIGNFFSSLSGKDLMDAALLSTAVAGTLGGRSKTPHQESLSEIAERNKKHWGPEDMPRQERALKRQYIQPSEGYEAGLGPEHQYFNYNNYAHGGYVDGHSGGQTDDVPTKIPEGAYVMDATTVSLLGDGNSRNGARKIRDMEQRFLNSGITKDYMPKNTRMVNAKVSDGEYIVDKRAVSAAGKGNNARGGQVFDKMRNNLRREKGVKHFLPSKSKSIEHYMR